MIVTVANTSALAWASSVKINSVTIWSPENSQAGNDEIIWEPSSSLVNEKDDSKVATIPGGIITSGALVFRPTKRSVAGFWVNSNVGATTVLFKVTASPEAVVEFNLNFTLVNNLSAILQTISTGSLSLVGYAGVPVVSPVLAVMGRPNGIA